MKKPAANSPIWEWDASQGHISELGEEHTGTTNTLSYTANGIYLKSAKQSNSNIGVTIANSVRTLFSQCSETLIEYSFVDANLTGTYNSNTGGTTSIVFWFFNPWETGRNRMEWRVVSQSIMAYRTTGSSYTQFNTNLGGTSGKIGISYNNDTHLYRVYLNDGLIYTESNAYRSGSATRTDMVRASSNNANINSPSIVISHIKITGA